MTDGIEATEDGGRVTIRLYEHQKEDLKFLRQHARAALFHEVGSGKTYPVMMRLAELLIEYPELEAAILAADLPRGPRAAVLFHAARAGHGLRDRRDALPHPHRRTRFPDR